MLMRNNLNNGISTTFNICYLGWLMDDRTQEKLSKLLKDLRGDLTQRNFAKKIGVSHTALRSWEECVSMPGIENLKKIAEHSGRTVEQLIFFLQEDSRAIPLFDKKTPKQIAEGLKDYSKAETVELIKLLLDNLS